MRFAYVTGRAHGTSSISCRLRIAGVAHLCPAQAATSMTWPHMAVSVVQPDELKSFAKRRNCKVALEPSYVSSAIAVCGGGEDVHQCLQCHTASKLLRHTCACIKPMYARTLVTLHRDFEACNSVKAAQAYALAAKPHKACMRHILNTQMQAMF